jgi:hypothetical protein
MKRVSQHTIPNGLPNKPVKAKKIPQPYSPPELFTLHMLAAFIGNRGSGKTHAMVSLARKYIEEGSFNRVFIISPTYESNPIFHVLHAEEEDVYTDLHGAAKALDDILAKCAQDDKDYRDFCKYKKAYERWKMDKTLTYEQQVILQNNQYAKPPPNIPAPSPLLILDDMSHSDIYSTSRSNAFINLCLRHRHINKGRGISIFMATQTFRTGLPKALRQNVTQMFIWPTKDQTQRDAIYHEIANLVDKEEFESLYDEATKEPHSFLTIDSNAPHPSLQFRKNFDTYLSLHNS